MSSFNWLFVFSTGIPPCRAARAFASSCRLIDKLRRNPHLDPLPRRRHILLRGKHTRDHAAHALFREAMPLRDFNLAAPVDQHLTSQLNGIERQPTQPRAQGIELFGAILDFPDMLASLNFSGHRPP